MVKGRTDGKRDDAMSKAIDDHPPIILIIFNSAEKNEIIHSISSSVSTVLGYQPQDLTGKSLRAFIHPDDLGRTMECLKGALIALRKQPNILFRIKHANGSWVDVELIIYTGLLDSNRTEVIGSLISYRGYKEIEYELQKIIQKNKAILRALPDIMFIINDLGIYEEYYSYDQDILAIEPKNIIGNTLENTGFSKEDILKIQNAIHQSLQNHSIESVEYSLFVKGKHRIYETRIAPFDANKVLALARDVTKQRQMEKDLYESERLFKEIFEYAPIGIYRTTSKGEILLSNATLWNMLGYNSFEELAERDLEKEGYHPSYKREFFKKEIAVHGRIIGLEATWKKKDGSLIYVRENAHAIYGEDGTIVCFEGTVEDITEKKETEELLRVSKEQYRLLVEHQQDFIIKLDSKGNITYASPSFLRLLRRTDHKLINTKLQIYVHKDDHIPLTSAIKSIKRLEETIYLEIRMIHDTGWRWIAWKFNPIKEKEHRALQIIAAGRDITDQKMAEIELSETKERLQNIIDNSKDIIITFDIDHRISSWNRSLEKITGFDESLVLHKPLARTPLFKNPELLESIISKAFNKKQAINVFDLTFNTKEGDTLVFQCSTSPIFDKDHQLIGLLVVGSWDTKNRIQPVKQGKAYVFTDEKHTEMFQRFEYLLEKGYIGLTITRGSKEIIERLLHIPHNMVKVFGIEKNNVCQTISSPSELISTIKGFLKGKKKSVILIDRLDFLLIRYPFEMVMESIYTIHSLIISNDSIIFLHLNTTVFNSYQLALIKEELIDISGEKGTKIILERDLLEILEYIYKQNESNSIVSYQNIGKTFSISKVTTQKRIKMLEQEELITVKKRGKMKILFITDKARDIVGKNT